jgi:hypothetical protein
MYWRPLCLRQLSQPGSERSVEQYCIHTSQTDSLAIAVTLMKNPALKMHGPEHHFLVPAVLLTAFYNQQGSEDKAEKIRQARKRAEVVKGGFCGFYGACGAGVGTGIFISVVTGATPLSKLEWKMSNLMTAQSLRDIAMHGGPRCCKRDTYLALQSAVKFLKENYEISIQIDKKVECEFYPLNNECLQLECTFYPN